MRFCTFRFTIRLQCFDAVGWAAEGHPACKKTEWWGAGMVICLERGADLHTAQLTPLPLTVSCFSNILIGFTFLVPAHLGTPGKRAVKWVCVCVCGYVQVYNQSEYNKRSIHRAIINSSTKSTLKFYADCPRMIPRGLNPVCHRMPIIVSEYPTAQKPSRKRKSAGGDDTGKSRRKKNSTGEFHFPS